MTNFDFPSNRNNPALELSDERFTVRLRSECT